MKKLCFLLLLFGVHICRATITLPAVISSNMVLQQQTRAKLWGWGNPTEKVFITGSWNAKTDSTVVTGDGKWELFINTPAAGGPYNITIKGYNTIVLTNVLIGEVWVCSGQSNMEYNYYWGVPQIGEELLVAQNSNIRFFNIPRTTANAPQEDCRASWTVCDSNTIKSFSAVGYFFGKRLHKDLGVPIGLVHASWGGTPAEVWTPADVVKNNPVLQTAAAQLKPSNHWPVTAGATFNGMIAPLTPFSIAGAIWYQGESNTETASTYQPLFTALIQAWRRQWNKEFPFYYVQLAPFNYGTKNSGALLREAQANITLPKTGMVITTDLADDTLDIHPKNKRDVGDRLAKLALQNTYEKKVAAAESPVFKNIIKKGAALVVEFEKADAGLLSKGKTITGVYIAGADQNFYPAAAKIKAGRLEVWSIKVPAPVAVRYAFSNTAVGNLFSVSGMPVAPFRTDAWKIETGTNH
jgi:sialate O-acetylesterase